MKSPTNSASLEDLRAAEAAKALAKLKHEVIPLLEAVIAGTPTGQTRDLMTDANIILHSIV